MKRWIFCCLSLLLVGTALAQTPADSVSRSEAIDSVVVTARKPLMIYKQTGNIAVNIEQLKYAPLFAGEKDIFKFLQLLPGVSAGKDGMSGLLVRGGSNDQTLILYDDDLQPGARLRHSLDFQRRDRPIRRGVERLHIACLRIASFGPDADPHTRRGPAGPPTVAYRGNAFAGRNRRWPHRSKQRFIPRFCPLFLS